jgi:RNA polymerase sigma-70 factor (ECF subfamily)
MEATTFQGLYEAHWVDVMRLARYLTGDSILAEEIASETFLRAWVGRERIRTETGKAYVLAIARNLAMDHHRRRRETIPIEDGHATTAPTAGRGMELDEVMAAVRQLPAEYRDPLVLTAVNGLSYEEAGRVLGVPLASVKMRIHRARLKLSETLKTDKETRR